MRFYLGVHHPNWLETAGVPLFVSRRTLTERRSLPRAIAPWALDSGGFTELQIHGEWKTTAAEYVADVRRFRDEIGMLDFVAPLDWMCEPIVIAGGVSPSGQKFVGTKLSVEEHQRRTIENYLELRSLAPELPFIPVLQGWSGADYWHHQEDYARAGVDLATLPLVGVGTVCRRQATATASSVMATLHADGLKLHGFGFKKQGLRACAPYLASADSLAWSQNARRNYRDRLPGHTHASCSNCLEWALLWRDELLAGIPAPQSDDDPVIARTESSQVDLFNAPLARV